MSEALECAKHEHLNWPNSYRSVYRRIDDKYFKVDIVCGRCASRVFSFLHIKTMTRWAVTFSGNRRFLKEDLPEGVISVTEMKKQNKDWK